MVRRKTTKKRPSRSVSKYIVTVKQTLRSVPVSKTEADRMKARVKKRSPAAVVTMRKV